MKNKAYLLVFDGLAGWEPAHALCELAVADKNIVTASGLESVDFAREVIRELNIYSEADTQLWFEMFKHGVIPASLSVK